MQVTRRDMLTAASTVGLAAALNHTSTADETTSMHSTFLRATEWSDIHGSNPTHLPRAAHILRQSAAPLHFDISASGIKEWKGFSQQDHTIVRHVRGLYETDTSDVRNLTLVYLIEYREYHGSQGTFHLPVIGCRSQSEVLDPTAVDACLNSLREDLIRLFRADHETVAVKMPVNVLRQDSLGTRLLTRINKKPNALDGKFTYSKSRKTYQPESNHITVTVTLT